MTHRYAADLDSLNQDQGILMNLNSNPGVNDQKDFQVCKT